MRTTNSIKNIYMSMVTQVVIILLGFLSRKVFLDNLGTEYLGVNGLLTNIISMLSLVEGGIGTSIVYNLYKPLADNDIPKITALIQLYKKIYSIIAVIVFALSLVTYPLVKLSMKNGETIPYISIVYFIFVIRNVISYLNAHKWSLIYADQKNYILAKYNLAFNIITTICKIIVLSATKNYILFLLIEVVIFIVQNIYNGNIVNKMYPYIKTKDKYVVGEDVKNNLITNVKALFLHNVGTYCVMGTDNLLIGMLINLKSVGLYSNYSMVIGQLSSVFTQVLGGIGASVGNLIATETKEKSYEVFKVTYFINFLIYSIGVTFLYNLLEPFIDWWLREGLLLDKVTFIILLVNFYITGLRQSVGTFKSRAGIFAQDKYVPLIESVINLGFSIILAKRFGISGIFMGTTISSLVLPVWIQAKLVYNEVFNKSVIEYFKSYVFYFLLTITVCILSTAICNRVTIEFKLISLVIKGIISIVMPSVIYIVLFYKTEEFKYLINVAKPIISKVQNKLVGV